MSFPYASSAILKRNCDSTITSCCDACLPCCNDLKCLEITHYFTEACTPARLAQLFTTVFMSTDALNRLPPVHYSFEICITNKSKESVLLQKLFSSLILPSKWSCITVRRIDPDGTVTAPVVGADGDLLVDVPATLEPCDTLKLLICVDGRVDTCVSEGIIGGLNCTLLQDRLLVLSCQPSSSCTDFFRNQHDVVFPA